MIEERNVGMMKEMMRRKVEDGKEKREELGWKEEGKKGNRKNLRDEWLIG